MRTVHFRPWSPVIPLMSLNSNVCFPKSDAAAVIKVLGCRCFPRSIKTSLKGYSAAWTQLIHNVTVVLPTAVAPDYGKYISGFKLFMGIKGNISADTSIPYNGQRIQTAFI